MRRAAATVVAALVACAVAVPAHAGVGGDPDDLPVPPAAALADSVQAWDPAGSVRAWNIADSVRELGEVETEGSTTTITLATDILFTPDSAEVAGAGPERIEELVAEIPDGATVQVRGHTDSRPSQVGNQPLSEQRADAVAQILRTSRPDLALEVSGHADTEPAGAEDPNDPATYAANRRVEIVYEQ